MAALIVSIPLIFFDLLVAAASIVVAVLTIPVQILQATLTVLSYVWGTFISLTENPKVALILILGLAFVLIVGPIGRDDTTVIIEGVNITNDCFVRPPYETVDKIVLLNVQSFYRSASLFYNRAVRKTFVHVKIWYMDITAVIDCIFVNFNIGDFLSLPYVTWTTLIHPLFYVIITQPLLDKREIFQTGTFGYWFPKSNTNAVVAQLGNARYEFDPSFGGQGPAPLPGTQNPIIFNIRQLYVQAAELVGATGDLVFRAVSELGRPGQLFFPNLIISVDRELSYWREISDLVCRASELALFTFVWPNDGSGDQPFRDSYETYACQAFRVVACFIRFFFLLLNDALTFARPKTLVPGTCPKPVDAAEYILDLLQGVPIVDLFISASPTANLNIFRSSLPWCQYGEDIVATGLASFVCDRQVTRSCPAATSDDPNCGGSNCLSNDNFDGNIDSEIRQVAGVTRGSYSPGCPVWSGDAPPLPDEKIDYIAQFLDCVLRLIELLLDPHHEQSYDLSDPSSFGSQYTRILNLVGEFFNVLILDTVYFFDITNPVFTPSPTIRQIAPLVYVDPLITDLAINLLEFIYRPDTCGDAIPGGQNPNEQRNIALCLIALGSRAKQGLFVSLCKFENFLDKAVEVVTVGFSHLADLNCDFRRKRFAAEHFEEKSSARRSLTTYEIAKLRAAKLAFFGREAWRAVENCRANTICDSTCALAPCMPALLDCVSSNLTASNPWRELLHRGNTEGFYVRNSLVAAAVASDVIAGCNDNALNIWFSAFAGVVEYLRDIAVRYTVVSHKYAPSYEWCNRRAHEAVLRGDAADLVVRSYLECIGLQPSANSTEQTVWSDTLETYGIRRNDTSSWCSTVLHENGFLIDKVTNRAISAEHSTYKTCAFLLAFGAAATSQNGTHMLLSDFTDLTLSPFALLQSASRITAKNYPEDAERLLASSDTTMRRALPFERRDASEQPTGANKSGDELIAVLHPYLAIGYGYINYLADLYEKAIIVQSDGETKDMVDQELYGRFVAVMVGGSTVGKRAAREYVNMRKRAADATAATVPATTASKGAPKKYTFTHPAPNDFSVFTNSFFWVNDISGAVESKISTIKTVVGADGLALPANLGDSSVGVEAFIDFNPRIKFNLNLVRFGLRPVDDLLSTNTFGHLRAQNDSLVAVEQENYRMADIAGIVAALDFYSKSLLNSPLSRHRAAQAVSDFNHANEMMHAVSIYDDMAVKLSNSVVVRGLQTVIRVAWTLAWERIRPNAIPQYQSALVVIDALTSGDNQSMKRWIDGELGYIPNVGFVSIESYDIYMAQQNKIRRQYLSAYSGDAIDSSVDQDIYIISARSAERARVEDLKNTLPGSNQFQRWIDAKRMRFNVYDYKDRGRFMLQHDVLHLDDSFHHAAGPTWTHYERALEIADDPVARVELALITAPVGSSDFFIQVGDTIFTFFGANSTVVTDLVDNIEALANKIGQFLFVDTTQHLKNFGNTVLTSLRCRGIDDYGINGTGEYRLGCLPFLPERMFEWIEFYPKDLPQLNILTTFVGPGYIAWPDEMLAPGGDCVHKRIPVGTAPGECPLIREGIFDNISSYFKRVCITNACRDPNVNPPQQRPLCFLGCDYCERVWKSAADFGFIDGWDNLAAYDSILHYILTNAITDYSAYFFVVFSFLVVELAVNAPSVLTVLVVVLGAFGEVFYTQRFDRIITVITLAGLTAALPAVGWISYAFYVVALFGPAFGLSAAPPTFMLDVVNFIINHLLPGPLIVFALNSITIPLITFVQPYIGFIVHIDTAPISEIAVDFQNAALIQPTFAYSFYAVVSFYNIFKLGITLLPLLLGAAIGGLAAFYIVQGFFNVLFIIFEFLGVLLALCVQIQVFVNRRALKNDLLRMNYRLRALEDRTALTRPPPVVAMNKLDDNADRRPVRRRRQAREDF